MLFQSPHADILLISCVLFAECVEKSFLCSSFTTKGRMEMISKRKLKTKTNRLLASLLTIVMVLSILTVSGLTAFAEETSNNGQLLTQESIIVQSIHGDGSQGDILTLDFEQDSGLFAGKLANYTDLAEYNDSDIIITLKDLPEGTTAQLKTESGQKIVDFVAGTARTINGAVSKKGEYAFVISLQNGNVNADYTLKLEKAAAVKWNKLIFAGDPEFNSLVTYYGAPEGTLFQMNDNGERSGKTGLSEDCYNYEVYVSASTAAIKPAGGTGIGIFKSFFYTPNCKTSIYIDGELLPGFENVPTAMAVAMKWQNLTDGVKLINNRTEMRIEFKISDTEVINTIVTFVVVGTMDTGDFIRILEEIDTEKLVYPDDKDSILKLYQSFINFSDTEKAQIPNELKEKLERAYQLMIDDRVPSKLEIVKPAVKLTYSVGQTFNPAGTELLATYDDGTTRTITDGFIVVPNGALRNETEVTFIYNTINVTQPIKIVGMKLAGEGTQENPYKLTNAEDLQNLNDVVASGQSTEGMFFEMTADITLPSDWKPIGVTIDGTNDIQRGANLYAFSGTIDGKNHTLTVPEGGLPLIGYVKGAEVRNLNIYGKKIAGYGLVNNLEGVGLSGSSIVIDNVTLKSGSSTLKSGLLGANITTNGFAGCSAGFVATVRNCTIEKDVIIGYNKDQNMIGSIAGRMQGTVENCVSYATVYGTKYVGGIVGTRDNAMGISVITNCTFGGSVEASEDHAGGILGGGYSNGTAPNGYRVEVTNCSSTGTITGADKVGGIMGADTYVLQSWGENIFSNNKFSGTVKATDGEYVGGVTGYLGSLNKYDNFSANYYSSDCSAEKGIGFVKYVDTSCETHETESGTTYINTSAGSSGISGITKTNHNRNDDPLGADAVMLTYSDDNKDPIAIKLSVQGECKTSYYVGEPFDPSGLTLTVIYHTGESKVIELDDVEISGYDSNKRGTQTVTLMYGAVSAQIDVTVLKPVGADITVTVSLFGDYIHSEDECDVHTMKDKNLEQWVHETQYTVSNNATVWDVLQLVLNDNGMTCSNPTGNYIESITRNNETLGEFANGSNSGWVYTLNGSYPLLGVSEQFLDDESVIVFHYTDDYVVEKVFLENKKTADEVITLIDSIGNVELSSADAIAIARSAYDALTEEQQALVLNYLKLLEAETEYSNLIKAVTIKEFDEIYESVGNYISSLGTPGVGSIGGEWMVIGLTRSEKAVSDEYYTAVVEYVKENINDNEQLHRAKSTDNSRIILALTSLGYDVTDVAGHNLLAGLSDMSYVKKQGINGPIWALIAFDSHEYDIPLAGNAEEQVTREKLVSAILDSQLSDGGWSLSGNASDADITAMAIQALSPYYAENTQVKEALDNALSCLSDLQTATGGYLSWGTMNSESCAQVIVALTSLGIDPHTDSRFIKNGCSALDSLMSFYIDGGFRHTLDGDLNEMSTEQGYYALSAYYRFKNGKTSLYDMSDVNIHDNPSDNDNSDDQTQKPDDSNSDVQTPKPDNSNSDDQTPKPDDSNSDVQTPKPDNNNSNNHNSKPDNKNSDYPSLKADSNGNEQNPHTGDSSNTVMYLHFITVSLVGLIALTATLKRKKKQQ